MAAILFLAPDDLGEAVLATGALTHALQVGGRLAVVCAEEARALFRAAPGLIALHPFPRQAGMIEAVRKSRELTRMRVDLLIDARGGWLGTTISSPRRVALKSGAVGHRAEQWAQAMGAERALAPKLWIDGAARSAADALAAEGPLIVLAPGGVDEAKRWPRERFAAVARRLVSGPLANAQVVILGAAARDDEITRAIVTSLDADGVAARDVGRKLDLLASAGLLERATLCLGNDNALTHIAAAVGAPTLTLFGPTDERVRAPFGPRARTMRARTLEEIAVSPDGAMDAIGIDAVEAAALDLLHAGGLR